MNRLSELRAHACSTRLLRAAAFAWIMGAIVVIHCLALATIVFSGPLQPFVVPGAGMMLFGGIVFCLVIGVASSYPGVLAVPQEVPATVLGTLGAAVAAGTADAPDEVRFMTMVAMLVLSGLTTGLFFLAVGHLRLSNLFRFIPYPVAGGFFAGTGWVLSVAAISVMSGVVLDWRTLPQILEPATLWKWGPGAVYGLVLVFAMRRRANFAVMVGSVVLIGALYHLALAWLDIPVADAKARGLLLSGMPEGGLWPTFGVADLANVDWTVVAGQVPGLLTVTLVTLLCLLVYLNGLEVATGVEVDLDREFRLAGVTGMCAGAGGSVPGCHSFVFTLPCRMVGVDTPWNGVAVAFVVGLTLFFGSGVLELLPMSVIGGLLLFIGVELLDSWVIKVRKRLHWSDYVVILVICVTIVVFGFVEGVGVGMLATLAMFAFRLSRVDVIADEFTGSERASTKVRSVPDRTILVERGELLRAYRLRGYIFFGSAHPLVDHLKRPLGETPAPACILLDFEAVSGCDFSAVNVLCQFAQAAHLAGARLVCSAAPGQIEESLRNNVLPEVRETLRFERDLDHGLERCEDLIIELATMELLDPARPLRRNLFLRVATDLERNLDEQIVFEELVERLEPWVVPRTYEVGDRLAVRGEVPEGLQLIVSGQTSVHDGAGRRLYQCGPGDVLEPWAAFTEHMAVANAIARTPCRTMMLTPTARGLLESDDNELSLKLFAFLIGRQPTRGGLVL